MKLNDNIIKHGETPDTSSISIPDLRTKTLNPKPWFVELRFASKEDYLEWVANWKEVYRDGSKLQRASRLEERRNASKRSRGEEVFSEEYFKLKAWMDSLGDLKPRWSDARDVLRRLMQLRKAGKIISAQVRQATLGSLAGSSATLVLGSQT